MCYGSLCVVCCFQHMVEGIPRVNLPDVCTDPPLHGKAFCASHCAFLRDIENDNGLSGLKTPTKMDMIRLGISPARNRYNYYINTYPMYYCTSSYCSYQRFRRFASKRLPMYSPIKRGLRLFWVCGHCTTPTQV